MNPLNPRLDHIGIAVADVSAALAFFRDALGLPVELTEEVASQGVRAHVLAAGDTALELLEATAADSPIARFIGQRGPGLHHLTLRVADVAAALAQLKARGIRLIDETPRPGAEGALIAFVHPSAAHGVLVELKQGGRPRVATIPPAATQPAAGGGPVDGRPIRTKLGEFELISVNDGFFRLDGGAMFGVVPRPLWQKRLPPDDRNRITLGMRPLVVQASWGRLMIDCGAGDKWDAKSADIFGISQARHLARVLGEVGLSTSSIDVVLASHLHFDHFGGATIRDADGTLRPQFERARYLVRRAEWEHATHPHDRDRASYLLDDFMPLQAAGVLDFHEGDEAVKPGVRVERTGGHTGQHQVVFIESGGRTAVFTGDMLPTTAHVADPWIMGYDLYPMETLAFKKRFIPEAIEREYLIFFEHDPLVAAGYIRETNGKRYVEPLQ